MEIRLDGEIRKARITTDNPKGTWEIRLDSGRSFFSRKEIEESDLQLVKTTSSEWEYLSKAGFKPPYIRE